ncbi:response regulator transcription factor [Serratia fonticola]|uniref:response regulator transcription factor n=1 Tax=Serratia fonticola TaxID=47917 RepID=UPI00192BB4F3|nr:response regulator transcription factor [Serratia fonticola]MBL5902942.1 response regulator transcription factor [Serratia fonticola]
MMTSLEMSEPVIHEMPNKVCYIGNVMIMETCSMTRKGIRRLLEQPTFQVMHYLEAPAVNDISLMMLRSNANLVIMDLSGEGESIMDGLRVIGQFQGNWPMTPLIVCTVLADTRLLKQLVAMGVSGIYLKQDPLSSLTECISQVMENKNSYSTQVTELLADRIAHPPLLTYREMDVLECLFTGKSVKTTAQVLHRDIRTISTHKRNAMIKLGFNNNCELYTWGAELSRYGAMV